MQYGLAELGVSLVGTQKQVNAAMNRRKMFLQVLSKTQNGRFAASVGPDLRDDAIRFITHLPSVESAVRRISSSVWWIHNLPRANFRTPNSDYLYVICRLARFSDWSLSSDEVDLPPNIDVSDGDRIFINSLISLKVPTPRLHLLLAHSVRFEVMSDCPFSMLFTSKNPTPLEMVATLESFSELSRFQLDSCDGPESDRQHFPEKKEFRPNITDIIGR